MEIATMWTALIFKILIALGLINVWLLRFNRTTAYRGGEAKNMKEEFATYGLPLWSVYVVGFLKISIALVMILTVVAPQFIPTLGTLALGLLVVLMLGAISMHIKVKDSLIKILPASCMLLMSVFVLLIT
jgi:DoxX-like family